ncbi:hypothetical protein M231_04213 [Tremella mesenterica]|uniref:Uncharacterized protein n=1 Tax=Tremella mesenterica TaxID=5217 RepID=A0A4Q1BKZ9_TREME|nr:hypothetical protein M231_04213 [Tremella mesenterica]
MMKTATAMLVLSALGAIATPLKQFQSRAAAGYSDTQILQYALTLENLEKSLYSDFLAKYSAQDFANAGYPDWVRSRLTQVSDHEAAHVELLSTVLGSDAVQPCTYSFPYTDIPSFLGLSSTIENVGVSAYSGAAQYITSPAYLSVAAVILSTEARHQAWESSAVLKNAAWSGPYDTVLGLDMVYTLASAFITSCPDSNAALPVKAFPALTVNTPTPGATSTFSFKGGNGGPYYAIFYNGLGTQSEQLDANNAAMIPSALQGFSYVIIASTGNATAVTDDNIVAGPAILSFPFNSKVSNPGFTGQ